MNFTAERLRVLQRWAERVIREPNASTGEKRSAARLPLDVGVVMLPLDADSYRPDPMKSVRVVAKNESPEGLGVLSNSSLESELFFAERGPSAPIYVLGKVWEKSKPAGVVEYGFKILDRYDSFEEFAQQQ